MTGLHIALLGGLEIAGGKSTARTSLTRKARALVAYLALQGGRGQSREKLAELLWGDSAEEQARANLRQALWSIRKILNGDGAAHLVTDGEQISLAGPDIDLDVAEFERLVAEASPEALSHAAKLYKGDLLEGFSLKEESFESWARAERERLRHLACDALTKLIAHCDEVGDTERCVETAARLLTLDPLREAAHRILMRAYAAQGRQASALKQFETCRDILKRELGVEPESETVALYRELRQQRAATPESETEASPQPEAKDTPLPDKPSIAVLPFTNLSGDPEQQYFSDGITCDIITALGKFRNLFVIADTSSFAYRDKDVAVRQIGQDLGVHYILKGNVRAAGGKIRVSVQLIDATTGQNVWAERYDHVLDDVFALQDEITQTVVATLVGRIEDADYARAKHASTTTSSVYEYILRGMRCLGDHSEDDVLKARAMFEQALELDPNYARTYVELADSYYIELLSHWSKAPDIAAERILEYAQKAVALDDLDSRAHATLGRAYYRVKANHELAEAQFEKAIALNPNDVWNYCTKGFFLTCSGRLEEGISCDTYALRLNPLLPDPCLYSIGVAHYLGRRYEDAVATFGKMSYLPPEILGCLAASYAQLGRDGEARATANECHERTVAEVAIPLNDDAERWRTYWLRFIPLKEAADRDHLFDGLRKAGLPA